jgi:hypothetical protein
MLLRFPFFIFFPLKTNFFVLQPFFDRQHPNPQLFGYDVMDQAQPTLPGEEDCSHVAVGQHSELEIPEDVPDFELCSPIDLISNDEEPSEQEGGELYDVSRSQPAPSGLSNIKTAKSLLGGIARKISGVQPYIWVRNCSDKDILVVVSEHRPRRLLTGGGISGSIAGGGFTLGNSVRFHPSYNADY